MIFGCHVLFTWLIKLDKWCCLVLVPLFLSPYIQAVLPAIDLLQPRMQFSWLLFRSSIYFDQICHKNKKIKKPINLVLIFFWTWNFCSCFRYFPLFCFLNVHHFFQNWIRLRMFSFVVERKLLFLGKWLLVEDPHRHHLFEMVRTLVWFIAHRPASLLPPILGTSFVWDGKNTS